MAIKCKAVEVQPRVIKRGTCRTLSGKSELTYCLGELDGELMMRIQSNDGGGFFSIEWILISKIVEVLENCDPDKSITSERKVRFFPSPDRNPQYMLQLSQTHL